MAKPRKPANVNYKGRIRSLPLIEVFEDTYAEQFAEPEDILVKRTVRIFDDIDLFEDLPYETQAQFSRRMADFLVQYAAWIETQPKSEDPN